MAMSATEDQEKIQPEVSSSSGNEIEQSPLAKAAAQLLYKRLRIEVADGRILVGDFICLDKQGNIILNQTVEQYEINGTPQEKVLGQVLVPFTQRKTCDVEVMPNEKSMLEALLLHTKSNSPIKV